MNHLIKLFFIAISFVFLSACGGSDSSGPISHKDAYELIMKGMTPTEVQAVVGEAPTEPLYSNGIFIGEIYSRGKPNTPEWTSVVVSYDYLSKPSTGVNGKGYVTTTEAIMKDYTK